MRFEKRDKHEVVRVKRSFGPSDVDAFLREQGFLKVGGVREGCPFAEYRHGDVKARYSRNPKGECCIAVSTEGMTTAETVRRFHSLVHRLRQSRHWVPSDRY